MTGETIAAALATATLVVGSMLAAFFYAIQQILVTQPRPPAPAPKPVWKVRRRKAKNGKR